MGLKEQIREKNAAAGREEVIHLPTADVDVLMIGMKLGDRLRISESGGAAKSVPLMIALTAHDPATRQPLWNANDFNDKQAIEGLGFEDSEALAGAASRVSGMAPDSGKASPETASSSSSSQ